MPLFSGIFYWLDVKYHPADLSLINSKPIATPRAPSAYQHPTTPINSPFTNTSGTRDRSQGGMVLSCISDFRSR